MPAHAMIAEKNDFFLLVRPHGLLENGVIVRSSGESEKLLTAS